MGSHDPGSHAVAPEKGTSDVANERESLLKELLVRAAGWGLGTCIFEFGKVMVKALKKPRDELSREERQDLNQLHRLAAQADHQPGMPTAPGESDFPLPDTISDQHAYQLGETTYKQLRPMASRLVHGENSLLAVEKDAALEKISGEISRLFFPAGPASEIGCHALLTMAKGVQALMANRRGIRPS